MKSAVYWIWLQFRIVKMSSKCVKTEKVCVKMYFNA